MEERSCETCEFYIPNVFNGIPGCSADGCKDKDEWKRKKTPEEIKEEYDRSSINFLHSLAKKYPDEFSKMCEDRVRQELKSCVNELCYQCGSYKQEHLGSCDGCKWKEIRKGV